MCEIINEIIEIKSIMINVFCQQIQSLNNGKIDDLKRLNSIEENLFKLLTKKKEIIRRNKKIITQCNDYEVIEALKDKCLTFEKMSNLKNKITRELEVLTE